MKTLLLYLLISFFSDHALSIPQSDQDSDSDSDNDLDYSEPGVATDCICVPMYQCVDGEIVSDGTDIINPRIKEVKLDEMYVPPECGPYHVCCRDPDASTVAPYEHRCGTRNPNGINGRILSSKADGEAQFGEWPWQAAILRQSGDEITFKCGGTLIDEKHILTTAHCVDEFSDDASSMVVRLGEWDTQNTDEFLPHEDFDVSEIIIHPKFSSNNLYNDIAILKLARNVTFKPNIDSVCLPRDEDDFTGENCIVTGWGKEAYRGGSYSVIMKEVSLPVLDHEECQNMLRRTRLGRYFKLHRGFLCAGGKEGEDSCKGDGGGPLVCFRPDNSYTVAGLVSWGIDCGQPNVPGVYVDVKKYIDWIASKTNKPMQYYWSTP